MRGRTTAGDALRSTARYFWKWSKKRSFGKYSLVQPGNVSARVEFPSYVLKPEYHEGRDPHAPPQVPEIKNESQIRKMRDCCRLAAEFLNVIGASIKVGQTTDEMDRLMNKLCLERGVYPSTLNYRGFPKSLCTSVNNVACHGIPDDRPLEDGDMINVDLTIYRNGYHGDCSKTFAVGDVDEAGLQLMRATKRCLDEAVAYCGPGRALNGIGALIDRRAAALGVSVVGALCGHGIGRYFHGPPEIMHVRNSYPGAMSAGMTFTIEPALAHGDGEIGILEDGWTAVTVDGARSAQFEHTVLVTEHGVEILTEA